MLQNIVPAVICLLACAVTLDSLAVMDLEYVPWYLANGRLFACVGATAAAAIFAGVILQVQRQLINSTALVKNEPGGAASQDELVAWPLAAGAGGAFALFSTLLAEDYARVLGGVSPPFLWRWLLTFLCGGALLALLFRYGKSVAACRYAGALMPALALVTSRWFSGWTEDKKLMLCWMLWAVFARGIGLVLAGQLPRFIPRPGFAALFCLAAGGATFLWCYNKIVYNPRQVEISPSLFVFLLTAMLAMACAGLALLAFLAWLQRYLHDVPSRPAPLRDASSLKMFAVMFASMAAVWMVWWWAYFPGNLSPDSVYQWRQALGIDMLEDSQPLLSSLLLTPFARLCPSPALFLVFQVLACAAVYAAVLSWWMRNGLPRRIALALAVVFALWPSLGIHAVTLWKDVWFCLGLFWLSFLFTRLIRNKNVGWGIAAETVIALVVVACFRHNGIAVAAFSGLVLLLAALRWHIKQLVAGALASFALLLFIQGPLYTMLDVPHYSMGLSGLGSSSIGAAFTYQVDMPEDLQQMAEQAMPRKDWEENYDPYQYFGYFSAEKTPEGGHYFNMFRDKNAFWVMGMWMRLFVRSPLVMFHERMAMCDSVLFVDQAPHPQAHSYYYQNKVYPNKLGIAQGDTPQLRFFNRLLEASSSGMAVAALLWRNGLWWIVCLWLCYFNFLQKRARRNFFFLPMLANLGTLMLAVTEQGFRYTYNIVPYMLVGAVLAAMPLAFDDTLPQKKHGDPAAETV